MFEGLTERLGDVFGRLTRRGSLSAGDVEAALREVRVALLEADAALPAVRALLDAVKEQAVGHEVLRSVTPGQQVVKIVHDRWSRCWAARPRTSASAATRRSPC